MMICTDLHVINRCSNQLYSKSNLLHTYLILLTTTNNSVSSKQHPEYFLFILAASTEHPNDKRGEPIVVTNI